jgi:staphylococcal nuclease domain-containing protein 1
MKTIIKTIHLIQLNLHLIYHHRETVFSLRMAEKEAQTSQRFIWTGYQPAARSACVRYFEGVVIEIVSGDTLIVVEGDEGGEGIERKITLSSIKVPRMGNIRGEGMEAWATESRDLLRARVIGRKVGVAVEYEKIQASPSQPSNLQKRVFATVKVLTGKESEGQGRNIALMLVTEGVATCVRHREGEERSCEYDSYLMAEAETAAKGKGKYKYAYRTYITSLIML